MIEIDPGIIDSQELMKRVKISVIKKKIPEKFLGTESENSFDYSEQIFAAIAENLQKLRESYAIVEKPIVSNRPVIGRFIVLIKKVYRKMTRWIFASYYQQQTQINETIMQTLSDMIELQELMIATCHKEYGGIK